MILTDCLVFATTYPVCHLATADGGQPHVRVVPLWFADERGFYFVTESPDELSRQLHANPRVEISFSSGIGSSADARTMRVTGTVEFVADLGLIHRVAEEGMARKEAGEPPDPATEVFRLCTSEARFAGPADRGGQRC